MRWRSLGEGERRGNKQDAGASKLCQQPDTVTDTDSIIYLFQKPSTKICVADFKKSKRLVLRIREVR